MPKGIYKKMKKKTPKNTLVVIACIETYRMINAKFERAEDSCHFTYRTAIFFLIITGQFQV